MVQTFDQVILNATTKVDIKQMKKTQMQFYSIGGCLHHSPQLKPGGLEFE